MADRSVAISPFSASMIASPGPSAPIPPAELARSAARTRCWRTDRRKVARLGLHACVARSRVVEAPGAVQEDRSASNEPPSQIPAKNLPPPRVLEGERVVDGHAADGVDHAP
jgi:hypothetical protein